MKTLTEQQYKKAVEGVGEAISKLTDLGYVIPPSLGLDAQIDKAFSSMMEVYSKLKNFKPTGGGVENA